MKMKMFWLMLSCILALMCMCSCDVIPPSATEPVPFVCTAGTTVDHTSSALLYYPCNISGPMAATTLTSGANSEYTALIWLSMEVASNDFVVLAMTPTENAGPNSLWRDAHLSGIARLEQLNVEPGTLQNKIDINRLQLCGHSRGGAGALMAAALLGSKIKSTIAMAPYHEDFDDLSGITSATLVQAGTLDVFVPPQMATGVYDLLPAGISKAYFEYASAHHFSWGAVNLQLMHETLNEDVVAWMKYYLDGNAARAAVLSDETDKSVTLWQDTGPTGSGSGGGGGCDG